MDKKEGRTCCVKLKGEVMITTNGDTFLRENPTDFTCNICTGAIVYVQVVEKPMKLVADFFQCDRCGYRIETKQMQEEEFPAFYD